MAANLEMVTHTNFVLEITRIKMTLTILATADPESTRTDSLFSAFRISSS